MKSALERLLRDPAQAAAMTARGLQAVAERHTCRHRALQLLEIVADIRSSGRALPAVQYEGAAP
jgi:spore maturation protein CgeB